MRRKVLDLLLAALKDKGLVAASGKQRTDSTHVVAAVRDLNRLELAGESVLACLGGAGRCGTVLAGWGGRGGRMEQTVQRAGRFVAAARLRD